MTATSIDKHETNRAFYDRISEAYDWLADSNERAARQAGVAALGVQPGEQVLELGFGTGNEILDLAKLVGPKGKVCGIDISPGMLAVAQRKINQEALSTPIELRAGDARALPYAADSFDAVYSSFTLELFPDADVPIVLAQVRRVLRKNGRLAVVSMATVKPGDKPSMLERTYVWMHCHFPHIVDCRPIDLARILEAAHFSVVRQNDLEIWTMPVAVVLARKQDNPS